jgi:II/X family phage/plasmid replication protein
MVCFGVGLGTFWSQDREPILIDWVSANIRCFHRGKITDGHVASVTPAGELQWQVEKRKSVPGSHDARISVRALTSTHIELDGNPAKWLQGHNLFGTDDLVGLVRATMERLVPLLDLSPMDEDIEAWSSGDFRLTRVDCTGMWELPRRGDVRSWLRAAELQSKSRHGRPVTNGGTLYFGKKSRRWSLKFYAKGDELEAREKGHRLAETIPDRDKLTKWADNKLRGELTLRGMQLQALGRLDIASQWTPDLPLRLLFEHIGKLQMADQFSLTPALLDGLPGRLVAVYKLWHDGEDLRTMYSRATFYRYRKELLKHGIDINVRQPAKTENVIPLIRVLRPEAIAQVPDWAIDTPLYFEPRKQA